MANHEVARIVDQLERGFNGDAWHGTPLRDLLTGVDATTAAERHVVGAHTIWELTAHITFWLVIARQRLAGEVVKLQDGDDWKVIDVRNAFRWRDTLAALDAAHEQLVAAVRTLDDADLDRIVPVMGYTNYVLLHGVLQHSLYHAGQIALLLRASQPG